MIKTNFPKKHLYLILIIMIAASLTAVGMQPTHRISEERVAVDFETMIPEKFGDWVVNPSSGGYIINPETEQNVRNIYSQTLSRSYINKKGQLIMLSVAYGEEQSDTKRLHYPEFCYPAQGFQIKSSQINLINTTYGNIKVKQLVAVIGSRTEPVTYWSTVGDKVVMAGRETKIEQLKYGFKGKIPDGMLFRVSSIETDKEQAYLLHQQFVSALISSIPSELRLRLAGLTAKTSTSR